MFVIFNFILLLICESYLVILRWLSLPSNRGFSPKVSTFTSKNGDSYEHVVIKRWELSNRVPSFSRYWSSRQKIWMAKDYSFSPKKKKREKKWKMYEYEVDYVSLPIHGFNVEILPNSRTICWQMLVEYFIFLD